MSAPHPPDGFLLACRQHGLEPTRFVFCVTVAEQSAALFEQPIEEVADRHSQTINLTSPPAVIDRRYSSIRQFRCSTSKFGIGQVAGSNCTPLGLHRIAEKIGEGCPVGTVFEGRQAVGFTWEGRPQAPITTRILWLEGLEPGFNRGGNVDSHARYIYIHGTGDELTLGRPASHGCVHLAAEDLVPLYDLLPVGTLVWISEH